MQILQSSKFQLVFVSFILLFMGIVFVIMVRVQPGWDFRNNLWGPAYLMVNHQSPYQVSILFDIGTAIWFPIAIGIWFFLGYLPLQQASNIWLLVNIVALTITVVIFIRKFEIKPVFLIPSVLAVFLFPSTLSLLMLGQISLLICLALLAAMYFAERVHPFWIGVMLAFSLSKPQLSFLFILAYLVYRYKRGSLKGILQIIAYTGLSIILECLPLFFFFPDWFPDLLRNLANNQNWLQPTIYSLLFGQQNQINLIFRFIFLLTGIFLTLFISVRMPETPGLLWILALTTIFSPYIWSWDFILLFPLLGYNYTVQHSKLLKSVMLFEYLFCSLIFISMKLTGKVSDELSWWIPWYLISISLVGGLPMKFPYLRFYNPH